MNLLCPDCHSSVPIDESEPWLRCPSCGLNANLSRIETAPGSASLPMVRDLSGETLGEYELTELIGVGGMGVVYRGHRVGESANGQAVAVKVLNCDFHWQRDEFVARFQREAKALAKLNHPHIVTILDSGRSGELYYLVTEYVEGLNLAQYLRANELSLSRIVAIMTQVCEAITYAHGNGIVHRDIKPANVVISGETAKVLDFGLAQITGSDSNLSSLTRTDLAMGTINYLSPEQRTCAKQVDERSDVFSLGVVLYEMLTGRLPLGSFEPPSRARPEVGRHGDRVVQRVLDADPERRYPSVAALAEDLGRLGQRRPLGRVAAVAAVAVVALAVMGIWKWGGPAEKGRSARSPTAATAQPDQQMSQQVEAPDAAVAPGSPNPASTANDQATGNDINTFDGNEDVITDNTVDDNVDKDTKVKKPTKRTRGRPVFVEGRKGRRVAWMGGKGYYRLKGGAVAIIDDKGQRWPVPSGKKSQYVWLQLWMKQRSSVVKGVKGTKKGYGVKKRHRPRRRPSANDYGGKWKKTKRSQVRKTKGRPVPRRVQPRRSGFVK